MKTVSSINALRTFLKKERDKGKGIGFVPTMGALHQGHLSLIKKCRAQNDIVVLSIFINPTQFGPSEDFSSYPRQKKSDCLLAKKENVDIIFYPSKKIMYPTRYLTYVNIEKITSVLCGKSRPNHFRGVSTIVCKLLNIVSPDVLYLGQKDVQQCAVIKQMVRDLNFPTKIKIIPTVREKDGLAMSSRNKHLSPKQRNEAPALYKSLQLAKKSIRKKYTNSANIKKMIAQYVHNNTSAKIDYVECVNAETLEPLKKLNGKILIAIAARFGNARLIDNIVV